MRLPNGDLLEEGYFRPQPDRGETCPVYRGSCWVCKAGVNVYRALPEACYTVKALYPFQGNDYEVSVGDVMESCWEHSDEKRAFDAKTVYVVRGGKKMVIKRRKV